MYRINGLLKLDQKLFHSQDLAVLWGTTNRNTLYTTIKRYIQKGILIPVFKGLYSTVPLSEINPISVGHALLHDYSYLTTETVLAREGVISQKVYPLTFASLKSKKITLANLEILSRRLKPEFLFQTTGIETMNIVPMAALERAVADLLYFQPNYHFDFPQKINWQLVSQIQTEVGYR